MYKMQLRTGSGAVKTAADPQSAVPIDLVWLTFSASAICTSASSTGSCITLDPYAPAPRREPSVFISDFYTASKFILQASSACIAVVSYSLRDCQYAFIQI